MIPVSSEVKIAWKLFVSKSAKLELGIIRRYLCNLRVNYSCGNSHYSYVVKDKCFIQKLGYYILDKA
jgi:hypothetical protein